MQPSYLLRLVLLGIFSSLLVSACSQPPENHPASPPEVNIITAHARSVPLVRSLVGRLTPTRTADVRARVPGILLKRVYTEGSDVKEGQPLFEIDPAPLKATLNANLAALAQAQATAYNAHVQAERYRDLAPKGWISKSDLDTAQALERSSAAATLQAQANVDIAKINVSYATVIAPISGRAGQQQVTEGALVGQSEATRLTTIDQLDPIYVNFSQSVDDLNQLRRAQTLGNITLDKQEKMPLQIAMSDGTLYPHSGTLDFSDVSVDANTNAVALRATLPNPERILLPGMYVNIQLTLGTLSHVFLVPQTAVLRDATGPYVLVIGADNMVIQKRITSETLQGSDWIVTDGMNDGDQIIVTGLQKVKSGEKAKIAVTPTPATASAAPEQSTKQTASSTEQH